MFPNSVCCHVLPDLLPTLLIHMAMWLISIILKPEDLLCLLHNVSIGQADVIQYGNRQKLMATLSTTTGGVFTLPRDRLCVCPRLCFFLLCYTFMLHLWLTGIPDCSEEDLSVARALNLSWTPVLQTNEDETQTLINSNEVSTVCDGHSRRLLFPRIEMSEFNAHFS